MKLQSSDYNGMMYPLCDIEVKRDRIATITYRYLKDRRAANAASAAAMIITPASASSVF
jgi:hypothetical protein